MLKKNKGITLIALVITIIVLIILAGISISLLLGDNGIISKAQSAKDVYSNSEKKEQKLLNDVDSYIDSYLENNGNINQSNEDVIRKDISYVGKYADINGDGTIDGVIYIDLLVQAGLSGTWNENANASFTIPSTVTSSNVKDYIISQEGQVDSRFDSTPRDVVKLATTQTGSQDRFFVMGLDDLSNGSNTHFYWYKNAYGNMENPPTVAPDTIYVGTGRANTAALKAKFDSAYYGSTDINDFWNYLTLDPKIDSNDSETYRWFIPSRAEWSAFGYSFGITVDNKADYKLNNAYYSSTQHDDKTAWYTNYYYASINYVDVTLPTLTGMGFGRVSATF